MKAVFVTVEGSYNPPMGALYLGTMLKNAGHKVGIVDIIREGGLRPENRTIDFLKKEVKDVDFVGITALSPCYHKVLETIDVIKSINPSTHLCVGGPHVTIFKERIFETSSKIDSIAIGEAEHTILELAEKIESNKSLKDVSGIYYRENGNIVLNDLRPPIVNLDEIPFPSRDLLDFKNYHSPLSILTSRGCPFNCSFCSKAVTGRIFRFRTAKNIVDEIELLTQKYPKLSREIPVTIVDDTFNCNINRAKDVFRGVIDRKLDVKLNFVVGFHCNPVDKELFELAKKAGSVNLWFGIESGSDEILAKLGKGITKESARRAVLLAREAGIPYLGAHFIIGLPYETLETARETIRFMKELKLNIAGFNNAIPIVGTEMWEYVKKNGRLLYDYKDLIDYRDFSMNTLGPMFETPEFTAEDRKIAWEEAMKELDNLFRQHYLSKEKILKYIKSVHSLNDVVYGLKFLLQVLFAKNLRYNLQPKTVDKEE